MNTMNLHGVTVASDKCSVDSCPNTATTEIHCTPYCEECGLEVENEPIVHDYEPSRTCGVDVCDTCGDHKGLARCYCGWPNGQGRMELEEMGEIIDAEDDYF